MCVTILCLKIDCFIITVINKIIFLKMSSNLLYYFHKPGLHDKLYHILAKFDCFVSSNPPWRVTNCSLVKIQAVFVCGLSAANDQQEEAK